MTEFDRKIVVVTGASSGIGRAAAELFAARGARVAIFARSREKIEALAARHGDRMLAVAGEIADVADVERLFAGGETKIGGCAALVNKSGMNRPKLVAGLTPPAWGRVFARKLPRTLLPRGP